MQSISSETSPVVADSTHDTETLQSPGKRVFAAVPAESDHRCAGAGRENSDNVLPAAGNRARGPCQHDCPIDQGHAAGAKSA